MKYIITLLLILVSINLNAQIPINLNNPNGIDTVQYSFNAYTIFEVESLTQKVSSKINILNDGSGIYTDYLFYFKNFYSNKDSVFYIEYYKTNNKGNFKRYSKDKYKINGNKMCITSAKVFKLLIFPTYYIITYDSIIKDYNFIWVNKKGESLGNSDFDMKYKIYKENNDSIIEFKNVYIKFFLRDTTITFTKKIYSNNIEMKFIQYRINKFKTGEIDTSEIQYNVINYSNKNETKKSFYKIIKNDTIYNRCIITNREFENNNLIILENTKSYDKNGYNDSESTTFYKYDVNNLLISENNMLIEKNGKMSANRAIYYEYQNNELTKKTELRYSDNKVFDVWTNTYSNGIWQSTLIQSEGNTSEYFVRKNLK